MTNIEAILAEFRRSFEGANTSSKTVDIQADWLKSALTSFEKEIREDYRKIDWDIDVRYEPDVIMAFNKFIKKWCRPHYSHLIDTDEQDGQFMREKIKSLSTKEE